MRPLLRGTVYYEYTYYMSSQIQRQKVEWQLPGSGGREERELAFNRMKFSFGKKTSGKDGGDGLPYNRSVLQATEPHS